MQPKPCTRACLKTLPQPSIAYSHPNSALHSPQQPTQLPVHVSCCFLSTSNTRFNFVAELHCKVIKRPLTKAEPVRPELPNLRIGKCAMFSSFV